MNFISGLISRRHDTVVANAFSDEIMVRVSDKNEDLLKEKDGMNIGFNGASVGGNDEAVYDSNRRNFDEFTRLGPGTKFIFNVAGKKMGEFHVYVTIFTEKDSTIKIITKNLQMLNGSDLIVDASGYIRYAKEGKHWIDTDGKDHNPN